VQTTINPALDSVTPDERDFSLALLKRECDNLLDEVDRLQREREMQDRRLRNVMHLVCSSFCSFMQVTKGDLGFQQCEYLR
jgi:hypothetical protein